MPKIAAFFKDNAKTIGLVLGCLVAIGVIVTGMLVFRPDTLNERVDKAFLGLGLPDSFEQITKSEKNEDGDIITSSRVAQVRVYKVPVSMMEANNTILGLLGHQEDTAAGGYEDPRLSMHPESFPIEEAKKTCSPGRLALRSGTYATVLFSDSEQGAQVELDSDGKVIDLQKYTRQSCDDTSKQSYLTLVIWAM